MTFLGKLFLMFNLILSLAMMAAGTALYSTRIDWTDSPAKPGGKPGVLASKKESLKEGMQTIYPAENSFREALTALEKLEGVRQGDREFYSAKKEHNRTKATVALPAQEVVIDGKTGLPTQDKAGRPLLKNATTRQGALLISQTMLTSQIADKQKQNSILQKELAEKANEDAKETEKLTGTAMVRGLRQHILDEQVKQVGIQDEIDATKPLFINTRVEAAIVKERIAFVDRQIEGLKKTIEKLKKLDEGGEKP